MRHDHFLYSAHRKSLRRATRRPRVVFYCPIEWPFPDNRLQGLAAVDHLVAYTEFGRDILAYALRGARPARAADARRLGIADSVLVSTTAADQPTLDDEKAKKAGSRRFLGKSRRDDPTNCKNLRP